MYAYKTENRNQDNEPDDSDIIYYCYMNLGNFSINVKCGSIEFFK